MAEETPTTTNNLAGSIGGAVLGGIAVAAAAPLLVPLVVAAPIAAAVIPFLPWVGAGIGWKIGDSYSKPSQAFLLKHR